MAILKNTTINDTGFLQVPVGTTAQRPSTLLPGLIRFNSTTSLIEIYNEAVNNWTRSDLNAVIATGGTVYDSIINGALYRIHVFTNTGSSTFTVTSGGQIEYLIVGGGGGGGYVAAAGGGAGGLLTGTLTVTPQAYSIVVGGGGTAGPVNLSTDGGDGGNSSAFGFTAIGGGGGGRGWSLAAGRTGGSAGGTGGGDGGGGAEFLAGTAGTPGQGNAGGGGRRCTSNSGTGGGGGGAGGPGDTPDCSPRTAGIGGQGISLNISGLQTFYAGGGSGDSYNPNIQGFGGFGGGGNSNGTNGFLNGTPNTGGGGGGGGNLSGGGGVGGSGIVIVHYLLKSENTVQSLGRQIDKDLALDMDFSKATVYSGRGQGVADSRFNGIYGTLFNISRSNDTRTHRTSLEFNNVNGHIRLPELAIRSLWDGNFTGVFWVNWRGGTISGIFGFQALPSNFHFEIRDDGAVRLRDRNMADIVVNAVFPTNAWTHTAFTRTDDTYRIYVNGVEVGNRTEAPGNVSFVNVPSIGESGPLPGDRSRPFDGQIATTLIYSRAFTTQELVDDYNRTRWRFGV